MNHEELLDKANIKLDPIGLRLVLAENDLSKSRAGTNTVFHYCPVQEQRRSYASCLMIMELAAEAGTEELAVAPECQSAIRRGECPAVKMRLAEIKAGRALFYVDYIELMRRRAEKAEQDREESPVQFRRNKADRVFVPSTVSSGATRTTPQTFENTPKRKPKPAPTPAPPVESAEVEIETNIMEQVLKKVINDNSN